MQVRYQLRQRPEAIDDTTVSHPSLPSALVAVHRLATVDVMASTRRRGSIVHGAHPLNRDVVQLHGVAAPKPEQTLGQQQIHGDGYIDHEGDGL